jgi:hypothetical protein
MAHACSPSCLGGWHWEDHSLRPACETPSLTKLSRAKWPGGVAQVMKCELCKHEALSSNPSSTKTKQSKAKIIIGKKAVWKEIAKAGHWWLTPVIPTAQEAEIIRWITAQSQLQANGSQDPILKKKMAGGVAQGAGPEFKSQYLQTNMQNIQSECVHHVLFMQDIKGVYVRASLCQEYSKESTVPEIRDIQKSEGINS